MRNENKEEFLQLLDKLRSKQDTIKPREGVEIILKAIDELMESKSAAITHLIMQIRLDLDVELRMYELMI